MKVIKRNGTIVDFDKNRIINAIQKANEGHGVIISYVMLPSFFFFLLCL